MGIIDLEKYKVNKRRREAAEKIQKTRDMVASMDSLIQWAYQVGVCPECGGLFGRHGTYCPENTKYEHNNKK
jgi:hypothetical protein